MSPLVRISIAFEPIGACNIPLVCVNNSIYYLNWLINVHFIISYKSHKFDIYFNKVILAHFKFKYTTYFSPKKISFTRWRKKKVVLPWTTWHKKVTINFQEQCVYKTTAFLFFFFFIVITRCSLPLLYIHSSNANMMGNKKDNAIEST